MFLRSGCTGTNVRRDATPYACPARNTRISFQDPQNRRRTLSLQFGDSDHNSTPGRSGFLTTMAEVLEHLPVEVMATAPKRYSWRHDLVLIEHPLYLLDIACLQQAELKQNPHLLRILLARSEEAQRIVVHFDVALDLSASDPGRAHDHYTLLGERDERVLHFERTDLPQLGKTCQVHFANSRNDENDGVRASARGSDQLPERISRSNYICVGNEAPGIRRFPFHSCDGRNASLRLPLPPGGWPRAARIRP